MKIKKQHRAIYFSFLISIFNFLLVTCNSTEPVVDNLEPGRRDYEWKADTLYSPNNTLQSIWGSAPDDVWVVGPSGITMYDRCWHFDGVTWTPFEQYIATSPECVFGTDKNNVWIGGNDGEIFHYDGNDWKLFQVYTKGGRSLVLDIWGKVQNDMYAVGLINISEEQQRGFLLHFDGIKWTESYLTNFDVQFLRVLVDNKGVMYIMGMEANSDGYPDVVVFYEYINGNLKEIFKRTDESIRWASMNLIGDKTYFLIGETLCRYEDGQFRTIVSFPKENFGYQVYGRTEKDLFVRMISGLAHYNGSDLKYLYNFSNDWTSIIKAPLIFDNDIFFTIHDNYNDYNIILHGTLKN